jgi:hypothetical protein
MQVAEVCRRTDCLFSGGAEAWFNKCDEAELRRNSGVKRFAFLSSSVAVLRAAARGAGKRSLGGGLEAAARGRNHGSGLVGGITCEGGAAVVGSNPAVLQSRRS